MSKIIFMGTPAFSSPLLKKIHESHHEVVLVVTQPDRQVGRKKELKPSPVKEMALELNLPVFQPEKIGSKESVAYLKEFDADLIVTAAFGQFLTTTVLNLPRHGAVNVHASLLPKYRGGAPVHYALWNNDSETGLTYMRMARKMDAGAILRQHILPIKRSDNVGHLFTRLSRLAEDTLIPFIDDLIAGKIQPQEQNEEQATYSPNISKEQERINWNQSAEEIWSHIRAFNPFPGTYTTLEGQRFKIWDSEVLNTPNKQGITDESVPGQIVYLTKEELHVQTGDGILLLKTVQPSGKSKLPIETYLNGTTLKVNDQFI
ncbi:methionyl-tRNA formyltransferase [Atopobacter phocae]|uniref:methionyl-tRNA formyltransferase n=1 Tax=Atopobacter phocae TaxID=136492 RepID=UPI00046FD64D|nr:methionyl-tRNA formyltransferase [Atopobacter phocae]